jgi:hypothetical protein
MDGIIMFDLSPKLLESMHATLEGVFLPIMSNPKNQQVRGLRGQAKEWGREWGTYGLYAAQRCAHLGAAAGRGCSPLQATYTYSV